MKLDPMTTARRALTDAAMMACASASVRKVFTCGSDAPSIGSRIGSEPVASSSLSYGTVRPLSSLSDFPFGSIPVTLSALMNSIPSFS
jgi:hypothetical protein